MKSVVSKAINTKITNEDIKSKLAKLGNTCFILDNLVIDSDDDIFIRLSDINNARRELVNLLIDKRINSKKEVIKNTIKLPKVISKSKDNIKFHILVRNEQQLKVCLKYNIETIIVTDSLMYEKYKNKNNVYLRLPRVINNFMDYHNEKLVATELGAINKYPSHNSVISDYYLNVVNNCSINFLKSKNIKLITISPEVKEDNRLKSLDKDGVAIMLYGKMELMIMKYNPLKLFVDNYNYKIEKNKYYLKNKDNHLFRIIDNNNLTHLMHYKNLDEDINKYLNLGFRNFRIDFLDENEEDVEKLIKRYYSNYSDS